MEPGPFFVLSLSFSVSLRFTLFSHSSPVAGSLPMEPETGQVSTKRHKPEAEDDREERNDEGVVMDAEDDIVVEIAGDPTIRTPPKRRKSAVEDGVDQDSEPGADPEAEAAPEAEVVAETEAERDGEMAGGAEGEGEEGEEGVASSAASEVEAELAPLGAEALRARIAGQRQLFEELVAAHCAHTGLDLQGAALSAERLQELREKVPAPAKPYETAVPPWIEVVPEAGAAGAADRNNLSASMEAQATRIRVQAQPLLSKATGALDAASVPAFVELMARATLEAEIVWMASVLAEMKRLSVIQVRVQERSISLRTRSI